jgi:hypothetical protein
MADKMKTRSHKKRKLIDNDNDEEESFEIKNVITLAQDKRARIIADALLLLSSSSGK